MQRRTSILAAAAVASAMAGCADSSSTHDRESAPATPKQQVRDVLKSLGTGIPPAGVIDPDNYVQHNLNVPDGLDGFKAYIKALPRGADRVNTVRVFQDGDFVFAHSEFDFSEPRVAFDIYRFENEKIVEHWDCLQAQPATPNPSGHTMIDGTIESTEHDKTEANKALVQAFLEEVTNVRRENYPPFFGDPYIQHNPAAADGLPGLVAWITSLAQQGIQIKYDRVHHVLGEGDFVLAASEGMMGGRPHAFYDLFRIENDNFVEHWDIFEEIPPREQWKNNNGKF